MNIWGTTDGTSANMVSRKGNADPAEVNDSPQVVTEKVWILIVPSSCVTLQLGKMKMECHWLKMAEVTSKNNQIHHGCCVFVLQISVDV